MAQLVKNSLVMQETAYSAGDPGWIPESERSSGEGNGNPLQYFFFLQINNTNIYYRIIWLTFHILTLKERERERAENISPNWVLTNSAGNPMSQHI